MFYQLPHIFIGEGKGHPLQYSGLENSMDCIVHDVSKSWTQLSNFHFHFIYIYIYIYIYINTNTHTYYVCISSDTLFHILFTYSFIYLPSIYWVLIYIWWYKNASCLKSHIISFDVYNFIYTHILCMHSKLYFVSQIIYIFIYLSPKYLLGTYLTSDGIRMPGV